MNFLNGAVGYLHDISSLFSTHLGGKNNFSLEETQKEFQKLASVQCPGNPAEKRSHLDHYQEKLTELMGGVEAKTEPEAMMLNRAMLGELGIAILVEQSDISQRAGVFCLLKSLSGFMYSFGLLSSPSNSQDQSSLQYNQILSRAVKEVDKDSFDQAVLAANLPSENFLALIKVCRYLAVTYMESDLEVAHKLAQIVETLTTRHRNEPAVADEVWELHAALFPVTKDKELKLSAPSDLHLLRHTIGKDDLELTIRLALSQLEQKLIPSTFAQLKAILEEGVFDEFLIRNCAEGLLHEQSEFAPSIAEICLEMGTWFLDKQCNMIKIKSALLLANYIAYPFLENSLMCTQMQRYQDAWRTLNTPKPAPNTDYIKI